MTIRILLPRRAVLRTAIGTAAASLIGQGVALPALSRARSRAPGMIRVYEVGDRNDGYTLHIVARPVPVPGPGEVRLKVRTTGLNARDLSLLRGVRIFGGKSHPATRVPLDDNACEVLELGAGVGRVRVGDRVVCTHFPLWIDGAWDDATMSTLDFGVFTDGFLAEQVVVPADGLVKIPDSIPDVQAGTFPNAGLTAWHAVIEDAKVRPGETLVTLGTGGVSVFGMLWAKMRGARVAITSSSDAKLERMRALGADITINYRSNPNWHQELLEKTAGRGADVVLNTVGIAELERSLLACASNARVMVIGANPVARGAAASAAGVPVEPAGLKDFPRGMIMKGLTIKGVIVGSRRMLEDLMQAAAANRIQPLIDRVFPFEKALDAVRYMESGANTGKIVIRVS